MDATHARPHLIMDFKSLSFRFPPDILFSLCRILMATNAKHIKWNYSVLGDKAHQGSLFIDFSVSNLKVLQQKLRSHVAPKEETRMKHIYVISDLFYEDSFEKSTLNVAFLPDLMSQFIDKNNKCDLDRLLIIVR